MSAHSKLDALRFYRTETAFEFGQLGSRVSWFATVQSFLITAFAIATGYKLQGFNWFAQILLPAVGLATSVVAMAGIDGACDTIDLWLRKQRKLLGDHKVELADFIISRDDHQNLTEDRIHLSGYAFAKWLPKIAVVMWIVICILTFAVPIKIS